MQCSLSTWTDHSKSLPGVRAICLGRSAKLLPCIFTCTQLHVQPPLIPLQHCGVLMLRGWKRAIFQSQYFCQAVSFSWEFWSPWWTLLFGHFDDLLSASNCLTLQMHLSSWTQNSTGSAEGELQTRGCCAYSISRRPCSSWCKTNILLVSAWCKQVVGTRGVLLVAAYCWVIRLHLGWQRPLVPPKAPLQSSSATWCV